MAKKKDKSDEKTNTSLRLNKKMLKALKIMAIQNETSVQKILEELIAKYLEEHGAHDSSDPKA